MSYTLEQLLWATRRGALGVSPETAASLVLSAAEQLRASPRGVSAEAVCLVEAGSVLLGDGPAVSAVRCDQNLRHLLGELLKDCGSEHPALAAVARNDARGPAELAKELAAALTPMNRGAIRRALCRLHRRLEQAGPPVSLPSSPAASPKTPRGEGLDTAPRPPVQVTPRAQAMVSPRATSKAVRECDTPLPESCRDAWTPPLAQHGFPRLEAAERTPFLGSGVPGIPLGSVSGSPRVGHEDAPRARSGVEIAPPEWTSPTPEEPTPAFGRFAARRSDVGQLISGFAMETFSAGATGVADALSRCIEADGRGESLTHCTPLPPTK